jgi:hypothetical protein
MQDERAANGVTLVRPSSASMARFGVVTAALGITIGLGYARFVRNPLALKG